MTKRKKILLSIALFIILSFMALFTFRYEILRHWLSSGPRRPKKEIATTHEIGWWAHQDALAVIQFSVDIVDSRLNLFNSKSLLSYTIEGTLKGSKNWKPYIHTIHLSERYINFATDSAQAIIDITPVIKVKEKNGYNGEAIPFHFTNELIIESLTWGPNNLQFRCAGHEKNMELLQRK